MSDAFLRCELCEKPCGALLPHPKLMLTNRRTNDRAFARICLRCLDRVRAELMPETKHDVWLSLDELQKAQPLNDSFDGPRNFTAARAFSALHKWSGYVIRPGAGDDPEAKYWHQPDIVRVAG